MVTAARFRSCMVGAQFQTSRYLIYPQLLAAVTALFLFLRLQGTRKQIPAMIVSLLILLFTYSHNYEFGKLGFERTSARAETRQYWHPEQQKAAAIAKKACDDGIYCIELER